jgi:hypothetical protein
MAGMYSNYWPEIPVLAGAEFKDGVLIVTLALRLKNDV